MIRSGIFIKTSLSILLVLLVASCSYSPLRYLGFSSQASVMPSEYSSYRVPQGTFAVVLKGRGTVDCVKEYNVSVPDKIWGSRIEKLTEEGVIVTSGEIICKLATRNIEEGLNRALSQLANAETEMEDVKNTNIIEEITKKTEIQKKDIQYEVNISKLEYIRQGADTADIAISEIGIEKNEAYIANFKTKMQSQKELMKRGFLSSFQFEDMLLEYQRNVLELEQNKNKLSMYKKLPDTGEVEKYEMLADKFKIDGDLTKKEFKAFLKINRLEEDKKKLDIKQKKHQFDQAKDIIDNAEIKSPIGGTLIYPNTWMGKTRVGMEVWAGLNILKIVDLSNMKITVKVNEKYVDMFKEGAAARIFISALAGKAFRGYVKSVSKLAKLKDNNDPKGPKEFDVTVCFSETAEIKLLPKMSADVDIICGEFGGVSKVPRDFAPDKTIKMMRPLETKLTLSKKRVEKPEANMAEIANEDIDFYYVKGMPEGAVINIPSGSEAGENGVRKN